MTRAGILIGLLSLLAGTASAADFAAVQGRWTGPWYIGMSSGIADARIQEDGTGTIALTNLEGFGDAPVAVSKTEFDGKDFRFSAVGENGTEFRMKLQLSGDGAKMRGNGKYGGFGARLELQKAP